MCFEEGVEGFFGKIVVELALTAKIRVNGNALGILAD
jgi:hypothetical protein